MVAIQSVELLSKWYSLKFCTLKEQYCKIYSTVNNCAYYITITEKLSKQKTHEVQVRKFKVKKFENMMKNKNILVCR